MHCNIASSSAMPFSAKIAYSVIPIESKETGSMEYVASYSEMM